MMLERWNWNLQFLIKLIWASYVQTLCVVAHVTRLCTKVLSNVLMLECSFLPTSPPTTHTHAHIHMHTHTHTHMHTYTCTHTHTHTYTTTFYSLLSHSISSTFYLLTYPPCLFIPILRTPLIPFCTSPFSPPSLLYYFTLLIPRLFIISRFSPTPPPSLSPPYSRLNAQWLYMHTAGTDTPAAVSCEKEKQTSGCSPLQMPRK